MEKLIGFFVKYPFWTNVFILITIIAGGLAFSFVKRSYFPERKIKDIYVDIAYPGASPQEIEESLTNKVEDNLRGIVGIDEILSTSRENSTQIHVVAKNRTDIDELLTDVKNAVDQINSFPTGAEQPKVYKKKPQDRCMYLTLTGDQNLLKTKDVAERIYDDLLETGFISQVVIAGISDPEISIEISENILEKYNVSMSQIQTQIQAYNRDITIGNIRSTQQEYYLRFKNKTIDTDKLEQIPILTANGKEVLLGDLATVNYQLPPENSAAVYNGNPCVNINVFKLPEEDILKITDYLKEYTQEFNTQNDLYELSILYDASESVRGRINLLKNNGITGLILVVVVLGIFLNFRLSFWVAFGIPISFLGMFLLTQGIDITINQISLFGMILVIGILVDDGIVISENIYTKLEEGMSPRQAAIQGTTEVLPAVFTSVLTTILVFCGFFFIEGNIGDIIPEMGIVVIGCLTYSLIEATLLLPAHLNNKNIAKEPNKIRKAINGAIDKVKNVWYKKYLQVAISWRWITFSAGVCLLALGIALFTSDKIGKAFFPHLDSNLINVEMAFYTGQSREVTEQKIKEVNDQVVKIANEFKQNGDTLIRSTRYSIGGNNLGSGNHVGTIEIGLVIPEERNLTNSDISKILRQKLNLEDKVPQSTIGARNNFGDPISYRLISKDNEQLELGKIDFLKRLNAIEQVTDITDNDQSISKEIVFELTDKATNLGFTPQDIVIELRKRFFGTEIQKLQKRSKEVKVWVRLNEEERNKIFAIDEVKIRKGAYLIPIKELATWSYTSSRTTIRHYNGFKEVQVKAKMADPDLPISPISEQIENEIIPELTNNYPELRFELSGQAQNEKKFNDSAIILVIITVVLIYFIIGLTFRSWLQPILVIVMIIPATIGAAFGHYIENTFVVIMSYLGSIALIGIIVNDAVVFVDKFNRNLKGGMSLDNALIDAGTSRFRAIILTSITTMAGLYPLIFEDSIQAQFLIPMAVTITYGVFFGTIMILFFFPILIACVNDIRGIIYWAWNGEWKEPRRLEPAVREQERLAKEDLDDEK